MMKYILSEHLKYKRSFMKKLIFIAPLAAMMNAYVLMPLYFSVNAYNWWYSMLLPAVFALIPALIHRYEERKLKYRAVFSLNVDLRKVWISKIIAASYFIIMAAVVHLLGVYAGQSLVHGQVTPDYGFEVLLRASAVLIITGIWQVPLCLFLAKKFGFMVSVAVNTVIGITLGIIFANGGFWLFCPYSWGMRAMVPMLNILPNGVPAEAGNAMINSPVLMPCVLSVILFLLISVLSAIWFTKQEVR